MHCSQRGDALEEEGNKESLLKMEIESRNGVVLCDSSALGNKESLLKMEIERKIVYIMATSVLRKKQRKSPENGD